MATQTNNVELALNRINNFQLDGKPLFCTPFGKGHINNTFLALDETARLYILQKINKNVFREPLKVMHNIVAITSYLAKTAESSSSILELVPSRTGELWLEDDDGEFWRVYSFIADSICYQRTEDLGLFRESGAAFGVFQRNLVDFPAHTLNETIPGFHNTPKRYDTFRTAINDDALGRVKEVQAEIDFVLERETRAGVLMHRHANGVLPLRVTHNDTKLNNVLFDRRTNKSLCVVDLDTVMPGFSVTDFGDSIRFGATSADEDERDLSKVSFSLPLFGAYTEGYLSTCGDYISKDEIDSLCDGALVLTLECGMRFLTDYLMGDVYFRINAPDHNLVRSRTQLKLVKDMEVSWDKMQAIIKNVMHN